MGCDFLLQRIFPTQELNPDLLYCRQMICQLSYEGSPLGLEFAAKQVPWVGAIEGLLPSGLLRIKLVAISDFLSSCLVSQHSGQESSGEMEALPSQITISNSIMMKNGMSACVYLSLSGSVWMYIWMCVSWVFMVNVHEYVRVWMCVCVYLCILVLIRNLSVFVSVCLPASVCIPVLRCPDFYPLLVGLPPACLYLLGLSSQ